MKGDPCSEKMCRVCGARGCATIRKWRANGAAFGFPKCCVDAFCAEQTTAEQYQYAEHGFVPCPAHVELLKAGAVLQDFIVGRTCPTPFPFDGFN